MPKPGYATLAPLACCLYVALHCTPALLLTPLLPCMQLHRGAPGAPRRATTQRPRSQPNRHGVRASSVRVAVPCWHDSAEMPINSASPVTIRHRQLIIRHIKLQLLFVLCVLRNARVLALPSATNVLGTHTALTQLRIAVGVHLCFVSFLLHAGMSTCTAKPVLQWVPGQRLPSCLHEVLNLANTCPRLALRPSYGSTHSPSPACHAGSPRNHGR